MEDVDTVSSYHTNDSEKGSKCSQESEESVFMAGRLQTIRDRNKTLFTGNNGVRRRAGRSEYSPLDNLGNPKTRKIRVFRAEWDAYWKSKGLEPEPLRPVGWDLPLVAGGKVMKLGDLIADDDSDGGRSKGTEISTLEDEAPDEGDSFPTPRQRDVDEDSSSSKGSKMSKASQTSTGSQRSLFDDERQKKLMEKNPTSCLWCLPSCHRPTDQEKEDERMRKLEHKHMRHETRKNREAETKKKERDSARARMDRARELDRQTWEKKSKEAKEAAEKSKEDAKKRAVQRKISLTKDGK